MWSVHARGDVAFLPEGGDVRRNRKLGADDSDVRNGVTTCVADRRTEHRTEGEKELRDRVNCCCSAGACPLPKSK